MMFTQLSEDENLEKGPWFPEDTNNMTAEERRNVRNLVLATKNGEEDKVKEILESGKVDVDSKYRFETALMVAARLNDVSLCELLLEYGADCNISRIQQQTPLWIAASCGNIEVIELLVASRSCSQTNLDNALRKCVIMNFLQGCDCLLRAGSSPDETDSMGFTSLHVAAGSVENTENHRRDNWKFQNQESWRLYHSTNFETCELLIMWKANVHAKDNSEGTPLHYACEAGSEDICRLLIENGADINAIGSANPRTPLHAAIAKDSPKIVKYLLQQEDIEINLTDGEGETPLMSAIQLHKQECVRTLLEDDRWTEMMSVTMRREPRDEVINTPMRELIRQMPDMACVVLNKCIDLSSQKDLKNPDFTARLHFGFLDDTYSSTFWNSDFARTSDTMTTTFSEKPHSTAISTAAPVLARKAKQDPVKVQNGTGPIPPNRSKENLTGPFRRKDTIVADRIPTKSKKLSAPLCDQRCFSCLGGKLGCRLETGVESYTKQNRILLNNHPLKIATQEKRYSVLCHPVVIALINHKWKSIGRYWFYGGLIIYAAFVALLNAHIMISFRYMDKPNDNTTVPKVSEEFYRSWKPVVTVVILSFCVVAVIRLTFSAISDFPGWLWQLESWLNIGVYATAVASVSEIAVDNMQNYQLAAACVFMAWFNMLLILRQFPVIGIFFIMFTRILKNSIFVLLVFTPLMMGFGFTFSLIAPTLPQFRSDMTFSSVLVMLSGEMEYVDSLTGPGSSTITHRVAAIAVYVIFTILMVICLLNLLVGIAVSDVDTLHNQAKAEMMSLKADKVVACEYYLSETPRKRIACGCMTLHPNKARFLFHKDGKKIKLKHRIASWFNIFGYRDTYLSPAKLVQFTLQDKCEPSAENFHKELYYIKNQLEMLTVANRALKNEVSVHPVSIQSPDMAPVPGARRLRKTFEIAGAPTRGSRKEMSEMTIA